MSDYVNFRQQLDSVLRTLDVNKVQNFLIARKQWQPGQPANPEFAMWMMIAGSPTLNDLHEQARNWLMGHGHEAEANAVLGRGKKSGPKQGGGNRPARPSKGGNQASRPGAGGPQKKRGPAHP